MAKSIFVFAAGAKNKKYANVKKISLAKNVYTLKAGKTAVISGKVVLADKQKKQIPDKYAAPFRYASDRAKVASVDKNGKIKAAKKGSCTIYVYAKNGYAKKVKVTVK